MLVWIQYKMIWQVLQDGLSNSRDSKKRLLNSGILAMCPWFIERTSSYCFKGIQQIPFTWRQSLEGYPSSRTHSLGVIRLQLMVRLSPLPQGTTFVSFQNTKWKNSTFASVELLFFIQCNHQLVKNQCAASLYGTISG